ncbi:hypothetical protein BST61_g7601 [Cercospora zeina]
MLEELSRVGNMSDWENGFTVHSCNTHAHAKCTIRYRWKRYTLLRDIWPSRKSNLLIPSTSKVATTANHQTQPLTPPKSPP